MNLKKLIPLTLCLVGATITSCDETKEVDAYANWEQRNNAFIESIKQEATTNASGDWEIIKDFNYPADKDGATGPSNQYVYAKKIFQSNSNQQPLFTDTVYVSYSGHLMPFDKDADGVNDTVIFDRTVFGNPANVFERDFNSYKRTLAPTKMKVSSSISGFATALMNMHVGDVWKVYIPYKLGYGTVEQSSIPAYSSLVFYIYLHATYPVTQTVPAWR